MKQVPHFPALIGTTRCQKTFYLFERETQFLCLLDELHSLNVVTRKESKTT